MQIDVLLLAEIIGSLGVIGGFIFAIFKFIETVKKQNREIKKIKKEQTLSMYALRACLDGLHQLKCNGRVTEAIDKIDKYLNIAAHDEDDI